MTTQPKQIIVIGGGYAGLVATVRLARQTRGTHAAVTLVNGTEHFIERLRLHQMAANQPIPQHSIPAVLRGTGVTFMQGWVTTLQPDTNTVSVQTPQGTRDLRYDMLVYTLGSTIDRDSVPGVRDHAYVLTPSGAKSIEALRAVLPARNARGGRLLVCGGGATGIEAAAEFAEAFPNLKVHLVTRAEFGTFKGAKVAAYMAQALQKLGVTIQDNTTISEVRANEAITTTGEQLPFDVCLWTGGFTVPTLARDAGLAVNKTGQILIDPTMRSISHAAIFAAGDAAQPVEEPGVPIRMSAFTALVTGAHAADCVNRTLRGKPLSPLSFAYYGQAIALGRHDAIGFFTYPADKARAPFFTGWFGFRYREFFATYAGAVWRLERRIPGMFNWVGKQRYAAAQRRAVHLAQQSGQD